MMIGLATPLTLTSKLHREPTQLSFAFANPTSGLQPPLNPAREPRIATIRLVEYARFPRVHAAHARRRAYTLDISSDGMCVVAPEQLAVGTLLHVVVHGVGSDTLRDALARSAWSKPTADGKWVIGLELIAEAPRSLQRAGLERVPALRQVA